MMKLVCISGHRGSGKDFAAETLKKAFQNSSSKTKTEMNLFRIGAVSKKLFCKQNSSVSLDRLMSDWSYKNEYRDALTKFYHHNVKQDQLFEVRDVWDEMLQQQQSSASSSSSMTSSFCCIVDLRMRYELKFFREKLNSSSSENNELIQETTTTTKSLLKNRNKHNNLLFIRIEAGEIARKKRGTSESTTTTDSTEIDLDNEFPDFVFTNDVEGTEKIESELVPLIYDFIFKDVHPSASSDVLDFLDKSYSYAAGDYDVEVDLGIVSSSSSSNQEEEQNHLKLNLVVSPHVLSPLFSYSGIFMIKNWNDQLLEKKRCLDIGCGTSILGLAAILKSKAAHVTAIDISEEAVRVSKENVKRHHLEDNIDVLLSDGFSALSPSSSSSEKTENNSRNNNKKEKPLLFDTILFNPPFFNHEYDATIPLTRAVYDLKHQFLIQVLEEAHHHLASKANSRMIVVFGSTGLSGADVGETAHELAVKHGWEIEDATSEIRGHKREVVTLKSIR